MSRLVIGIQPVREVIRAHGAKVQRVLVETGHQPSPTLDALARFAADHGANVERLPRSELDRLTRGGRHQGVVAFAPELSVLRLDALDMDALRLVVALDELEDPQNFGAVVRSSVALGVDAVVWPEHHSAPLSPATFRASAGAVEHAKLVRVSSLGNALADFAGSGLHVVGLDASGDHFLHEIDLTGPVVLVLGAEGKGLRKGIKRYCHQLAKIPMAGNIASLNASVAVAVAIYETQRQRTAKAP